MKLKKNTISKLNKLVSNKILEENNAKVWFDTKEEAEKIIGENENLYNYRVVCNGDNKSLKLTVYSQIDWDKPYDSTTIESHISNSEFSKLGEKIS